MAPYCIPLAADYGLRLADTLQTQRAQHAEGRRSHGGPHTGQISERSESFFRILRDRHSLGLTVENELTLGVRHYYPTGHATVDDEDIFVPTKLIKKHLGQNTLDSRLVEAGSIRSLSPNGTNNLSHPLLLSFILHHIITPNDA
jgi:hypothetical protein